MVHGHYLSDFVLRLNWLCDVEKMQISRWSLCLLKDHLQTLDSPTKPWKYIWADFAHFFNNNSSSSAIQVNQRRFIRTSFVSFVIVLVFSISRVPYVILWLIAIMSKSEFAGIPNRIVRFMKLFGTCTANRFIYAYTRTSSCAFLRVYREVNLG